MLENTFLNILTSFGPIVCCVVCSIIPLLEAKISIPIAINQQLWGDNVLQIYWAGTIAFFSSTLVAIILFQISKKIFKSIKNKNKLKKLTHFLSKKAENFSQKNKKTAWILFFFVACPIPSGLYTASFLLAFLNFDITKSLLILILGNFVNCFLVCLMCFVLKPFSSLILTIFLIIAILTIIYEIFEFVFSVFYKKQIQTKQ